MQLKTISKKINLCNKLNEEINLQLTKSFWPRAKKNMRISNRIGAATNLAIFGENMEYWWALAWTNYLASPASPHKVQSVAVRLAFRIHKMQTISNFDEFLPLSNEHGMSAIVVKNRQMCIIGPMPKNRFDFWPLFTGKEKPKELALTVARFRVHTAYA